MLLYNHKDIVNGKICCRITSVPFVYKNVLWNNCNTINYSWFLILHFSLGRICYPFSFRLDGFAIRPQIAILSQGHSRQRNNERLWANKCYCTISDVRIANPNEQVRSKIYHLNNDNFAWTDLQSVNTQNKIAWPPQSRDFLIFKLCLMLIK